MKYKNKITGAVIEAESELRGAWEAENAPPASLGEENPEKKKRGANNKVKAEK